MPRANVLVVDDDPSTQRLICGLLTDAGFDAYAAGDGADALVMARDRQPDAIILDVAMPVMDGISFYHRLRTADTAGLRTTPVLLLTALDAKETGAALGADASLRKPFEVDRLVSCVRDLVGAGAPGAASPERAIPSGTRQQRPAHGSPQPAR